MEFSFSQIKDIANNHPDWRAVIEALQDQPQWVHDSGPLDIIDISSIQQGGCASGAHMAAITYHTARQTMAIHGDDVLQYLEDHLGEIPQPREGESWSGLACFYLSAAIELWCGQFDLTDVGNC